MKASQTEKKKVPFGTFNRYLQNKKTIDFATTYMSLVDN